MTALLHHGCTKVVGSIYVNPTQFAQHEDFDTYQRNRAVDVAKLSAVGCHAVFCPTSLYHQGAGESLSSTSMASTDAAARETSGVDPSTPVSDQGFVADSSGVHSTPSGGHETWVTVERLGQGLCARSRPQFFRGVATVVLKLFNIVQPDVAAFGQKDYQQLAVIRRMVRDLNVPVDILGVPTTRECDGLAMSSRNANLSPDARVKSLELHRQLLWACEVARNGQVTSATTVVATVTNAIAEVGGEVDYVQVLSRETLQAVETIGQGDEVIAVAARIGGVRLIDNMELPKRNA